MRINFRRCKGRKCRTDLWNDKPLPAPETKDGQNFMRGIISMIDSFPATCPHHLSITLLFLSLSCRHNNRSANLAHRQAKDRTASLCDRFSTSPNGPYGSNMSVFSCSHCYKEISLYTHNTSILHKPLYYDNMRAIQL